MSGEFYVKFWGVRGTMPTPSADFLGYGGHTSCVEMRCGDLVLVFDAGTGIIPCTSREALSHIHLLLSHTHIDHIIGLCGMKKLFDAQFRADVWAGHLQPEMSLCEALSRVISPPIFPIPLSSLRAQLTWHDFSAGEMLHHDDFTRRAMSVATLPLHHPDRATAYRVNVAGRSVCYVTDVEHVEGALDEALIAFIRDSDIFIYDSTFDERDFAPYVGWGHSTWQHGMRLASAANVGTMVMFHHNPQANDHILAARHTLASGQYEQPFAIAREGLVLPLLT